MLATGSELATDIASMAATLPYCNVRDSFDHSIILLWQRHNLSHHIKSFSSISIHLQHILARVETDGTTMLDWTTVLLTPGVMDI